MKCLMPALLAGAAFGRSASALSESLCHLQGPTCCLPNTRGHGSYYTNPKRQRKPTCSYKRSVKVDPKPEAHRTERCTPKLPSSPSRTYFLGPGQWRSGCLRQDHTSVWGVGIWV